MSPNIEQLLISLLERMDARLTGIEQHQIESNKVQIRHEENLKTHMARSEAAEQAIELMRREFKPIKIHVVRVQTLVKALAWTGAALVGLATIWGAVNGR